MTLHPLRQPAPQVLAMAEVMPGSTMMDPMPLRPAAHPPVAAETVSAQRTAPAAPRSGLFAGAVTTGLG